MTLARLPWITASLFLITGVIQGNPELTARLEFDLGRTLLGELWRPLTGHLCHFNQSHFIGDAVAFCVWASVVELISRRLLACALLGTPALLGGWLLLLGSATLKYRGLSAIDCALATQILTMAYLSNAARCRPWLRDLFIGVGAVMLVKSVYEFAVGHAILAPKLGLGVRLLPEAHVCGVLVGLVTTLWWRAHACARHVGASRAPARVRLASKVERTRRHWPSA